MLYMLLLFGRDAFLTDGFRPILGCQSPPPAFSALASRLGPAGGFVPSAEPAFNAANADASH